MAPRKPRPTLSERLLRRIRAELALTLPPGAFIRRTYAGRHQRSAGAFVWIIDPWSGGPIIGSQERVSDLLRSNELIVERDRDDLAICAGDDV